MTHRAVSLFVAVLLAASSVRASDPITIDGQFQDWIDVPIAFTDTNGDGIDEDFNELKITNDGKFLFVLFSFNNSEVLLQELNQIKLFVDTDNRSDSGLAVHGIGADLEWNFGLRQGMFYSSTGEEAIPHPQISLRTGPTVSSRIFEIAVALDSTPMTLRGTQVVDTVSVVLRTSGGLDLLPDAPGGVEYIVDTTPVPEPEPIPQARAESDHVRIMTYNTLFGGLLDPARQPSFRRILLALNPDIMAFQEQENHQGIREAIGNWFQDPNLHSAGFGTRTIVSKFPILQADVLTTSGRSIIALLDTKSALGSELVLINSHLSCCQNNAARQFDSNEIISILRDWRATGNGPFPVEDNTPLAHVGDFNLVGSSFQLRTLTEGDISDENRFGNDFAPDWDGTPLADLFSRHTSIRMGYTWRNDNEAFTPGKLDYILYTDSVIELGNHFILNTLAMSDSQLEMSGLQSQDTTPHSSSDHLPRIMDIVPPAAVSIEDPVATATPNEMHLFPAYPNPFNPTTTIRYSLARPGHATLKIYNLLGREVAVLVDEHKSAGDHEVVFNASSLASGIYLYKLSSDGQTQTRKVLLAK